MDLTDWLAISGADSKRSLDEGIEVAYPAENGLLTEHLLLLSGNFDKAHIYASAEQNGAQRNEYGGETVLLIQPFTREKSEMQDVRWLIILENRIAIFGTPSRVREALHRYQKRANVERSLKEQLSQLPRDVSSWNLLVSATDRPGIYMHPGSQWSNLMDNSEVVLVGARFGSKVRVNFQLHANRNRGVEFFKQKVSSFAQVFSNVLPGRSEERRMAKVSFEADRVGGTIELSRRQFEMWGEQGKIAQDTPAAHPISRGE